MESAPEEKKPITLQDIESYKKEYDSKPMNRIIQNVLAKNKITKTIKINDTRVYNRHLFEIDIPTMKATNQQKFWPLLDFRRFKYTQRNRRQKIKNI